MSIAYEEATEIDSGILISDTETEVEIGIFGGGNDPWVKVPDAPAGSLYLKTTGETYRRHTQVIDGSSTEWVRTDNQSSSAGTIAFCLTDGSPSDLSINNGYLAFCLTDGSSSDIPTI